MTTRPHAEPEALPRARQAPAPPSPALAKLDATHRDVQALHPLLALLDLGTDEESPLQPLLDLLEQIVLSQRHQALVLEQILADVEALRRGRSTPVSSRRGV